MKSAVHFLPVMEILLTISTIHQAQARPNCRELLITQAIRYKVNSLKHLSTALATTGSAVSDEMLHAVGSHAVVEVSLMFQITLSILHVNQTSKAISMNMPAAEAHMDGLEKMIEVGGGLEAFSHDGLGQVFM